MFGWDNLLPQQNVDKPRMILGKDIGLMSTDISMRTEHMVLINMPLFQT
jgi:hypothetical protein